MNTALCVCVCVRCAGPGGGRAAGGFGLLSGCSPVIAPGRARAQPIYGSKKYDLRFTLHHTVGREKRGGFLSLLELKCVFEQDLSCGVAVVLVLYVRGVHVCAISGCLCCVCNACLCVAAA